MKIRLLLSYKGTLFSGWQKQIRQRTVQGEIEKILLKLFKKKISLIGSGRTDAGVHALGQTAHFELKEEDLKNMDLKKALNSLLPKDISVLDCWKAPLDFHARFSAKKKTYLYFIFTGENPPVLFQDLVWWKKTDLDLEKLNKMSQVILGSMDFKSFQSSGSEVKSSVRAIYQSRWTQTSAQFYSYKVTGSGFLKQMVRNLVGTYIDLLKESKREQKLRQILKARDRKQALSVAPGQGLYLKKVFYSSKLDKSCYKI